jgi:hypothetical protein
MFRSAGLQERVNTANVRREEDGGVEDGPIDVCFGREVHDRVAVGQKQTHQGHVGYIAHHETKPVAAARVVLDLLQVGSVSRIRQLVEDGHARGRVGVECAPDKARSDETGPAGDQDMARAH